MGLSINLSHLVSQPARYAAYYTNTSRPLRLPLVLFYATAAVTGIIAQYLLFGGSFSVPDRRALLPSLFDTPISEPFLDSCASGAVTAPYHRPGLGSTVFPYEDEWNLSRIEQMVSRHKGFLARDWPLHLGWNNLRYIIEAAMLEAKMTNRTLILPSFIYARSCTVEQPACAFFASQNIRSDEIGKGDYFYLPIEEQQTWRLPIGIMIDIPRLRTIHSVITVGEYLRYHHLPPSLERLDGHWDLEHYHVLGQSPSGEPARNLTTVTLLQKDYEPKDVVRVDWLPKGPQALPNVEDRPIFKAIQAALSDHKSVFLDQAESIIRDGGGHWNNVDELNTLLRQNGWSIVHTFEGVWLEMMKTVTKNSVEVAMSSQLRGFMDEFGSSDADILFLEGEIHSDTKPGAMRFTNPEERTKFATMVLTGVRPIAPTRVLAERIARKMQVLNGGRQFMSAHMRRGDFVAFGWSPESSIEGHLALVKRRLEDGRHLLEEIWRSHAPPRTVDVPGVVPDTFFGDAVPPHKDDKIFVATDERNATALAYLRGNGVVLISDLLTPEDRRIVGWPVLIGDVLAQVEQIVASHGAFFWGFSMSSVAGGIVNMRGARGLDPRTNTID